MRTVTVSTLRGENLIPQDGKTCDPYVEIRIGDHVAKTEKITGNHMDPKWVELGGFCFPWDGISALPAVEFFAWDFDYIGFDDFIGYARVPLHKSMINGPEIKVRLGVRDDGDKKLLNQYGTLGNLYFCITDGTLPQQQQPLINNNNNAGGLSRMPSTNRLGDYATNPNNPQAVLNQQRLAALDTKHNKDLFVSNRLQRNAAMHAGAMLPEFAISSITCEGIPIDDGTPVFVVMYFLDDEEWRTHPLPVQRGFAQWLNIQFDVTKAIGTSLMRFFIVRRDDQGHLHTVVSATSSPHPNTIGNETKVMCVPPEQNFKQQSESSWGTITYYLANRQLLQQQQQQLTPTLAHASPQLQNVDIFSVAPPQGGMYIRIINATDLLPLDYNEDPDPFVVAHWDNGIAKGVQEVFRTQTLKSVKDPVWDEVQEIRNVSRQAQKLIFTVFDQDPHGLDFAGTCEFDFLVCDPVGSFTFTLFSRRDDPEVAAQDEASLRLFGRQDFGTLTIEWNIDPALQERHRRMQEEYTYNTREPPNAATHQHQPQQYAQPHQQPPPQQQHAHHQQQQAAYVNPLVETAQPSGGYQSRMKSHQPGTIMMHDNTHPHDSRPQQPYPVQYPPPDPHPSHPGQLPTSIAHQQQQQLPPQQQQQQYRIGRSRSPPRLTAGGVPPQQQQQQPQRVRQPAPASSIGHGGVLVLTVLSVANINTREPICPYVRVSFQDESKDNCTPELPPAAEAVWNFKNEFYVADLGGASATTTTTTSGYPQQRSPGGQQQQQRPPQHTTTTSGYPQQRSPGGQQQQQQRPPQQQQQQQQPPRFVNVELCDARNHSVYGCASIEVARQPHRSRNIVVTLYAPGGRPVQQPPQQPPSRGTQQMQMQQQQAFAVAELSCMIALNPVSLPSDIPINASAMLELTVVGAKALNNSNKPNHHLHTNPYAIVTVQSRELGKVEYRSDVVQNTKNPKWFFAVPKRPVAPSDSIVVSIWDKDQDNFDEFLGQARFSVGTLVQSAATIELPLEGRPDARGGNMMASSGSANTSRDDALYSPLGTAGGHALAPSNRVQHQPTREGAFGTVTVEWAVSQQQQGVGGIHSDVEASAPHVVEVAIIEAANICRSPHNIALVQLSVDERGSISDQQPFTRPVSKQCPRWNQTFCVHTVGLDTEIRFTVWDELGRSGTFLGECVLPTSSLKRAKDRCEVYNLQLRPRQDPRYSREDLALLNSAPTGLGTLNIEARIFTMQEYERRQREALRRQGKKYQLILQVAGTADIGPHGSYFVTIGAGGEERTSQVEVGQNVHFRNNFNFELHNPTEMIAVSLYSRTNNGRDVLVGDVAFPVKPPSAYDTKPDEAWLTLRQHNSASQQQQAQQQPRAGGGGGGPYGYPAAAPQRGQQASLISQPPRVFIRWRTFPDTSPASPAEGGAFVSPNSPMPTTVSELQRELRKAREDMLSLSGAGRPEASHASHPQYRAHSPAAPFHASVYISMSSQLMTFVGTDDSTASDIVQYCLRQLNIFDQATIIAGSPPPRQYALSFRDRVFQSNERVSKYVGEKDVLLLSPAAVAHEERTSAPRTPNVREMTQAPVDSFYHAAPAAAPSYLPSLNNSRDVHPPQPSTGQVEYVNTRVLHRLQSGESSHMQTVSVFLSTSEPSNSSNVSWLVALCTQHRVAGFCHSDVDPDEGRLRTQFFIQSDPRDIVGLLQDVFARNPFHDLRLEEAYGFIPRVQPGFKWNKADAMDLSTMFMYSAEKLSPTSTDVWFLQIPAFRDGVGARYVNERG